MIISISGKKYIYRKKVTYKFKKNENIKEIDDSIRAKLTKIQAENLGKGVKVTDYGTIIDSNGKVITEFNICGGYYVFSGIKVHR